MGKTAKEIWDDLPYDMKKDIQRKGRRVSPATRSHLKEEGVDVNDDVMTALILKALTGL
jgi:hypothetical protein